jgi:hypothetical protein
MVKVSFRLQLVLFGIPMGARRRSANDNVEPTEVEDAGPVGRIGQAPVALKLPCFFAQ